MLSGDLMKRIRLARGLGRKAIADATGISERIIGGWERFENTPNQKQYDAFIKAVYTLEPRELGNRKKDKDKKEREVER